MDLNDPFVADAYFTLLFVCDRCGRSLDHVPNHEMGSEKYCEELASEARRKNCFCPDADSDGGMDISFCFCPDCAPSNPKN
jgi:hypothetical protein